MFHNDCCKSFKVLSMTDSQVACRDSDRTSSRTADVLRNVAELELIEAPTLSFVPPKSYNNLPQLRGDAQPAVLVPVSLTAP